MTSNSGCRPFAVSLSAWWTDQSHPTCDSPRQPQRLEPPGSIECQVCSQSFVDLFLVWQFILKCKLPKVLFMRQRRRMGIVTLCLSGQASAHSMEAIVPSSPCLSSVVLSSNQWQDTTNVSRGHAFMENIYPSSGK